MSKLSSFNRQVLGASSFPRPKNSQELPTELNVAKPKQPRPVKPDHPVKPPKGNK